MASIWDRVGDIPREPFRLSLQSNVAKIEQNVPPRIINAFPNASPLRSYKCNLVTVVFITIILDFPFLKAQLNIFVIISSAS